VRIGLPALIASGDKLMAPDVIAHETRFTEVLSLSAANQRRSAKPSQDLMQLGEILHRAAALSEANGERRLP
jgi:hypothetical protein